MARRASLLHLTATTALLVASTTLVAQVASGSLSGVVTDNKGRPLAGVHILLKSPALFRDRQLTTDAKGEWNAQILPIGTYRVVPTLDGYLGRAADNLRIGIGVGLRQDFTMSPVQSAQATVEVLGTAAGVDKSEATVSVNFSNEQMDILPTIAGRGEASALMMSVGVSTETISGQAAIRGGTILDTQINVNGASIKDDQIGAVTHTWYVEDNLEDIQVMLSPIHARYGRSIGGQVNMVTKTGSNDFHGSLRATLTNNAWNAHSTVVTDSNNTTYDTLNKSYQATFNGPIVRDRVWFSLATIVNPKATTPAQMTFASGEPFTQSFVTGNPAIDQVTATDVNTGQPLPGSMVPAGYRFTTWDAYKAFPQTSTSNYIEGKIKAALAQDHSIEVSLMSAKDTLSNTDFYGDLLQTDQISALGSKTDVRSSYTIAYNGLLGARDFIEARYTQNTDKTTFPNGNPAFGGGQYNMYEYDSNSAGAWINGGQPFGSDFSNGPMKKVNATGSVNYKHLGEWHGSHEIDLGYDYFQSAYDTDTSMGSDNRMYFYGGHYTNAAGNNLFPAIVNSGANANGNGWDAGYNQPYGLAPTMIQYLGQDGVVKDYDHAFYINDTWSIDKHWNMMLGLRMDTQGILNIDGSSLARSTDPSPRFQLKYDVKGDSRSLITFSGARYESNYSQAFSQFLAQNGMDKYVEKGFSGIPGQPAAGSANDGGLNGVRFLTFSQLTNPNYYQNVLSFSDSSQNVNVSRSLKPQAVDEYTLGFQHFNQAGSSIRFTYVNRTWRRILAVGQDYDPSQMVLLQDPSHSGLAPMYSQVSQVFNSSALKRYYQSLELDFNVKTQSVWSFGGNWTFSRLTGNNETGEDPGGGTDRINFTSPYYNNRNYLLANGVSPNSIAPNGSLVDDMTHRVRLFATAILPVGKGGQLSFSWMVRFTSGVAFGADVLQGIGEPVPFNPPIAQIPTGANGVPYPAPQSQTWNIVNGGLRPYEQNDQYSLDFKMGWSMPLGLGGINLIGDLTVTNLLNLDPPKPYNTAFMTPNFANASLIYPNPSSFGQPESHGPTPGTSYWVVPRTISATIGLRF
jgi:outer membrane receptor for ferrienterochelin and colicin